MADYNKAFFGSLANTFLLYKKLHGEEHALNFIVQLMEMNLGPAYDGMEFEKGSTKDFKRLMEERDSAVGLEIEIPEPTESRLIYRFHTDPFPGLKGEVDPEKFDATYIKFKIRYLLGDDWNWTVTKHIWRGDPYTEHVIEKE